MWWMLKCVISKLWLETVFSIVVVAEEPYTQQQPVVCAVDSVLLSAFDLGCRLVVEAATSSTEAMLELRGLSCLTPPPLFKGKFPSARALICGVGLCLFELFCLIVKSVLLSPEIFGW